MVNVEIITTSKFGECIKLENQHCEVLLALEYGPRIASYRLLEEENILFEDTDKKIFESDPSISSYFGMSERWYMNGGHRFWIAPEVMPETYFPDERAVEYEILENNTVILKQMPQTKNGLQLTVTIKLEQETTKLKITHDVKNIGQGDKTLAPWAITTLSAGGIGIFEMPVLHKAFLPNRTMAIWPYTDMKDPRLNIGTRFVTLQQDRKALKACKIGINNQAGYGAYLKDDTLFVKRYEHKEGGVYPDRGVSYETYTNSFFLELETLGELVTLKPNNTASHVEEWELKYPKGSFDVEDEASVEKFVLINIGANKGLNKDT